MHEHFRTLIGQAVERGEPHPGAAGPEGLDLASSLIAGVVSEQLANQPGVGCEEGRFMRLVSRLPDVLAAVYPPP